MIKGVQIPEVGVYVVGATCYIDMGYIILCG